MTLRQIIAFSLMQCRETMSKASRYVDDDLSWWDRFRVRLHLTQCWCCRRFVEQLPLLGVFCRRLEEDCGDHFPGETLSDDARERLKKVLEECERGES